jgi:hypothetical protein
LTSAAVKGLLLLSPSDAVDSAFAAKAISVFGLVGSTLASPRPTSARPDCALHGLVEWIIPARVQNDEPQLLRGLNDRQNAIERDCLVKCVDVTFKNGVNRDQVVGTVDLDSVPRVINDGNISVADIVREVAQRTAHRVCVEVPLKINDIEARVLERRRHSLGIVSRIGKPAYTLIGRIAYRQRNALLRNRGLTEKPVRQNR